MSRCGGVGREGSRSSLEHPVKHILPRINCSLPFSKPSWGPYVGHASRLPLNHMWCFPSFQGVVTGLLMIMSPVLFKTMGWKGVAVATPHILLVGGVAFFVSCILYQVSLPAGPQEFSFLHSPSIAQMWMSSVYIYVWRGQQHVVGCSRSCSELAPLLLS
jgi:hypothetical protein